MNDKLSKCSTCANSRIIVSENGTHPICCLSSKKAIYCYTGVKDFYYTIMKGKEDCENR